MIDVEREPGDFRTEVYDMERCCFCRAPTVYWHRPKDVAVCLSCAAVKNPGDVPSKREWVAKEQALAPRRFCDA